ncbi:hypothetical protein BY458DRAFT_588442 [Sporodiniella umbellata]|nr:hypothetical protein BY458DRAFT_588442 [Sporodiniella umbellata]
MASTKNIITGRTLVTGSLLLLGGLSIYYFSSKGKNTTAKKEPKEEKVTQREIQDENQSRPVYEATRLEHTIETTSYEKDQAVDEHELMLLMKPQETPPKTEIVEEKILVEEEKTDGQEESVPTATIQEQPTDTPYAVSSADENDIGTPESETVVSMSTFRSYDDIPEFIPQQKQARKQRSSKKTLTRIQLIEQQRQTHTPSVSARCNHWPRCTNKHCKYWHPFKMCRVGDACYYGKKCMFVHPSDYMEEKKSKEEHEPIHNDPPQFF